MLICYCKVYPISCECRKHTIGISGRRNISESCDSDFSTHYLIPPVGYRCDCRSSRNYHGQTSILTSPRRRRCLDSSSGVDHDISRHARTYRERSSSVLTLHGTDAISSRTDGDLECWISRKTIDLQVIGPCRVYIVDVFIEILQSHGGDWSIWDPDCGVLSWHNLFVKWQR